MSESPQIGMGGARPDRVPLGLGSLYVSIGDHIGHFYQTKEEWKALLVSWLKAGLEAGDKCVYFMSLGPEWEQLLGALADTGVNVGDAMASGQLFLGEGKNKPKEMQEWLARTLTEIPAKFPLLRWGGDMKWSLKKLPTSERLMEWESHCNTLGHPRAVFLCQYELHAFLGSVVMDALKTHPICVVSNAIHQNPYYEKPEVFLEELRRRPPTALAS